MLQVGAALFAVDCYSLAGLSAQLDIIGFELGPSRLVGRELPSSAGIHALSPDPPNSKMHPSEFDLTCQLHPS